MSSSARMAPTEPSAALEYVFDPRDPAPTLGGAISSGEPVMRAGAFDQSAIASRADVLVFETPPLDHDLLKSSTRFALLNLKKSRSTHGARAKAAALRWQRVNQRIVLNRVIVAQASASPLRSLLRSTGERVQAFSQDCAPRVAS